MSLSIPTIYADRYTLERPIGEGSFSRTYLAHDSMLQRQVAIKILRREHASNEEFTARFDREAQAAAMVSHPNVVPVYDYGREQGLPFIVMQYVDGQTLRTFAREEGPLTIEEAVSFTRQVLDGLAAIHDAGIVHRDVKPQNVLLDRKLVARLSDFGVAFLAHDATLTQTGATIGTAAYMAPEQATGQAVGPPADLYAVGVMLYELLTGRLPFRGDNPVQLMYRHVSEQPLRPRELNPAIPLELEAVVLRALAKLPVDRFLDARAMRAAIARRPGAASIPAPLASIARPAPERFQPEGPVRRGADPTARTIVGRPDRRRGRRWPLAMFAGALLLAGSGVVLALRELDDDDTPFLGALATATEAVQPAVSVDPTATPTGEEAVLAATEPDATPTDLPPATETAIPDDDDDDDDVSAAPTVAFNEPFLVTSIPPEWQQGSSASFGRDEFVDGGAYRREDGVLYDRPAAHLYAQDTDYPATTVDFIVDGRPDADSHVGIVITGMDDELPGKVPCRITLNGNVVWEGESPFENETWTPVGWHLGNLDWLKNGKNRLTIEMLVEEGEFGLPPWILLTEAAVYWD